MNARRKLYALVTRIQSAQVKPHELGAELREVALLADNECLPAPPAGYDEDRAASWRAGAREQLACGRSHPQQGCSPEFYDGWMAMSRVAR